MSDVDYCELCDLPRSTCIHGNPPAPPPPSTPTTRATPVVRRKAAAPRVPGSSAASAPSRVVRHRWTPPDVFAPHILEVLREAGGELDQDELFDRLETAMAERLGDADRETTPEGELRWRYAARRARQSLVSEGLMTKGRPGVWALS
ncbi:hypothetical protein [Nocardioides mangrovi]|uniref:Restriction system protein Mrr-like N-terminal domain-containing protein n=1 Tax=Nocardioides mangrovi TaxID=2874580 RepID=A0ABS7UA90_9ACTN|nr:hypothetical protein [Nocardioides mangrovi]MBZ5737646.1 hypothetical protein [Nocardioides mangrovi]